MSSSTTLPESPRRSSSDGGGGSPYQQHSVFSDVTMEEYYYDDDNEHNLSSSIMMEYSDSDNSGGLSSSAKEHKDSGIIRQVRFDKKSNNDNNYKHQRGNNNNTYDEENQVRKNNNNNIKQDRIYKQKSTTTKKKKGSSTSSSNKHHNHHYRTTAAAASPSSLSSSVDDNNNSAEKKPGWVKRWAYSFRSPYINTKHHNRDNNNDINNNSPSWPSRLSSSSLEEYPHYMGSGSGSNNHNNHGELRKHGSFSGHLPPPPPYDPWNPTHPLPHYYRGTTTTTSTEDSPLLGASFTSSQRDVYSHYFQNDDNNENIECIMVPTSGVSVVVAAAFLQDYEANRPPTFSTANLYDITDRQVTMYHLSHSIAATLFRITAIFAFFISSFLEGFHNELYSERTMFCHKHIVTILNTYAIIVFISDIWVRRQLQGRNNSNNNNKIITSKTASAPGEPSNDQQNNNNIPKPERLRTQSAVERQHNLHVRISRSEQLVRPLLLFCIILGIENIIRFFLPPGNIVLFTSICKPLVFYYVSSQARDALAAVRRILKIVTRVLIMEFLLILMFAAVACRLFHKYESFENLYVAWISLFELSTTVVNPSIWMPMYEQTKLSALFFVMFVITAVFYFHSLVLSVVFQTYILAAAEIHERNASDREDAIHLAFAALVQEHRIPTNNNNNTTADTSNNNDDEEEEDVSDHKDEDRVSIEAVRQTLRLVRPHYSTMKINALVEIVDSSDQGWVDYASFRTKIRQALNASIRTARNASFLAMSVELIAVAVAIANFLYVLLVSSPFNAVWFNTIQVEIGLFITLLAAFELLIRFNPLNISNFTPLTRLNATFDGSALLAALTSCVGMVLFLAGQPAAMEFILVGRSIDIIRTMRFFQIFRDIVRRTSDVMPALAGPLILVLTSLHIFVYTGMAIWGGSVHVGAHEGNIQDLYDLNNFNSYQEGAVTMFQVLVVNDWHVIANVFLFAQRCASPFIVYPFFIIANLINVSVVLNVLTAFFVETFVTKLNDDKDGPAEATATMHKERDFTIHTSERGGKRITSATNSALKSSSNKTGGSFDQGDDADSEASSEAASETYEFDVYERQGFDKIMQTVSGGQSAYESDFARNVCSYLEIFENLSHGREPVGYLVCDQQTLERYGNRRFKTKSIGFLDERKLHAVVTEMHTELMAIAPKSSLRDRSIVRTFPHKKDSGKILELSTSLLRRHPALSLFVARTVTTQQTTGTPPIPEDRK